MDKIAAIIVNYNCGERLADAVASVLGTQFGVEVIVSDNGSQDESVKWLWERVGNDARLRVILNERNLGFAAGNNVALKEVTSEYLLFLNPDCVIQPNTLMRMLEELRKDSSVGMAGCLIRNPDGTEERAGRRRMPTPLCSLAEFLRLPRKWRERLGLDGVNQGGDDVPLEPIEVEAISGAFMFVRRKALEQVGPLDSSYFLHCEDLDWCMRFHQAGWKILFVPDVEVMHYKGTCSKATPIRVLWYKHKGMTRFYRKFFYDQYPKVVTGLVLGGIWVRFGFLAAFVWLRLLASALSTRTIAPTSAH